VPQSSTFKNLSGFYKSAKRCKTQANVGGTSCRRKIFFIVITQKRIAARCAAILFWFVLIDRYKLAGFESCDRLVLAKADTINAILEFL